MAIRESVPQYRRLSLDVLGFSDSQLRRLCHSVNPRQFTLPSADPAASADDIEKRMQQVWHELTKARLQNPGTALSLARKNGCTIEQCEAAIRFGLTHRRSWARCGLGLALHSKLGTMRPGDDVDAGWPPMHTPTARRAGR